MKKMTIRVDKPVILTCKIGGDPNDVRYICTSDPYTSYKTPLDAIEAHIKLCVGRREWEFMGLVK